MEVGLIPPAKVPPPLAHDCQSPFAYGSRGRSRRRPVRKADDAFGGQSSPAPCRHWLELDLKNVLVSLRRGAGWQSIHVHLPVDAALDQQDNECRLHQQPFAQRAPA